MKLDDIDAKILKNLVQLKQDEEITISQLIQRVFDLGDKKYENNGAKWREWTNYESILRSRMDRKLVKYGLIEKVMIDDKGYYRTIPEKCQIREITIKPLPGSKEKVETHTVLMIEVEKKWVLFPLD